MNKSHYRFKSKSFTNERCAKLMLRYYKSLIKSYKGTIYMVFIIFIASLLQYYQIKINDTVIDNVIKTIIFINYFTMILLESRKDDILQYLKSKENNRTKGFNNLYNLIHLTILITFSIFVIIIYR